MILVFFQSFCIAWTLTRKILYTLNSTTVMRLVSCDFAQTFKALRVWPHQTPTSHSPNKQPHSPSFLFLASWEMSPNQAHDGRRLARSVMFLKEPAGYPCLPTHSSWWSIEVRSPVPLLRSGIAVPITEWFPSLRIEPPRLEPLAIPACLIALYSALNRSP